MFRLHKCTHTRGANGNENETERESEERKREREITYAIATLSSMTNLWIAFVEKERFRRLIVDFHKINRCMGFRMEFDLILFQSQLIFD